MNVLAEAGVAYYDEKGRQICGAQRNNKPGIRCQSPPMKGALRCAKHGGKSLKGAASPAYKTGAKSRYIGGHRLQERYEAALSDPEYLSMRPELAIIDAMLSDRWAALQDGGNDDLWGVLEKQFRDFKGAMAAGDVRKMRATINDIEYTIKDGSSEALTRQEIRELVKDRQRLAESMQKTLVNLKQTMTIEQTMEVLQRVLAIVAETVDDRREVSEVMRKVIQLTQTNASLAKKTEVVSV